MFLKMLRRFPPAISYPTSLHIPFTTLVIMAKEHVQPVSVVYSRYLVRFPFSTSVFVSLFKIELPYVFVIAALTKDVFQQRVLII